MKDLYKIAMNDFREKAKKMFNGSVTLSNTYTGYLYINTYGDNKHYPHINMYVDILGEPVDIRLALDGPNSLQVGWGGNNLLSTNNDADRQGIEVIKLVAKIFEQEEQWRDILSSIDIQPIIDEEIANEQKKEADRIAQDNFYLSVYNAANIVVGTVIKGVWTTNSVQRISATKVQIGKEMHTKVQVGKNLVEEIWHIIK